MFLQIKNKKWTTTSSRVVIQIIICIIVLYISYTFVMYNDIFGKPTTTGGKLKSSSRYNNNNTQEVYDYNTITNNFIDAIYNMTTQMNNNNNTNEILLRKRKEIQINNYRNGNAILLNFHITNHAGTTMCRWGKLNGNVPSKFCNHHDADDEKKNGTERMELDNSDGYKKSNRPWTYDQTDTYIHQYLPYVHYISWEWNCMDYLHRSMNDTNWAHPNLVSIIVMRNPLERILSSTKNHQFIKDNNKKNYKSSTDEKDGIDDDDAVWWWEYANMHCTDNYVLSKIMSKEGCCHGNTTSKVYIEIAKQYLQRFTFILDQDCFDESLMELSNILNLKYESILLGHHNNNNNNITTRERYHNDTLYDYLVQRNAADIELYNWSKDHALIQCQPRKPTVEGKETRTKE